jgi:hypothetical protein
MDMSNRTIQNLFVAYRDELAQSRQPLKNRKAIYALTHCRTRAMGVNYYACGAGHQGIEQFHSCRHRSCFLCAQKKRRDWIEQQKARLFDVPHFHVIFTLPHEYLPIWRYNEALFTKLLFQASQKTLLELLGDPRHGGVTPGILMALHTWGRQLTLHPHTHCLVSAGGMDAAGDWQALGRFLLPSAVIRRVYRGKLQALVKAAFEQGELTLPDNLSTAGFWTLYRGLYKKEWCVRIQERYEHGKGVVLYLARYCKGGPLDPRQIKTSNRRGVAMSYLDHRDKRIKQQRLKPLDFMQRLLQHVPAQGVHTVRYYGLYAAASKARHAACAALHGTLSGVKAGHGSDMASMLLYCKTCGAPAQLAYQTWPTRQKGISINKAALRIRAGGYVQQVDEDVIAKDSRVDSS